MTTIGFGIIGCGMIARWHAAALSTVNQPVKLIGVADADCGRAAAFAGELGVQAYDDTAGLIEDEQIQAVCICTPSGAHAATALKAINAGKHVLVEKPLALTVEDCDRLIEAAQSRGVCAGVVSQLRFGGAVKAIRSLLEAGELGRLVSAELSMRYYREPAYYHNSAWRGTKAMDGGGALMNQGIHGVDLLLHLMGPVRRAWGLTEARVHRIQVEDTAAAALRFANGALGTVLATTAASPGYPRRLVLTGERGSVTLTEDSISDWNVPGLPMPDCHSNSAHGAANPEDIPLQGHQEQIADFAAAIRNGRSPSVTLEDGRRAVELITAIYHCAHTGMPVDLEDGSHTL